MKGNLSTKIHKTCLFQNGDVYTFLVTLLLFILILWAPIKSQARKLESFALANAPQITQCAPDTVVMNSSDIDSCSAILGDYTSLLMYSLDAPLASLSQLPAPGSKVYGPHDATLQVSFILIDTTGLSDTCYIQVKFVDDVAPVIQCPADLTLQCGASIDPADTGMPTVQGDCDVQFSYNTKYAPETGCSFQSSQLTLQGVLGTGIYTRRWIATDAAGNADTCFQHLLVQDTTPPQLSRGSIPSMIDTFCTLADYQLNGMFASLQDWNAAGGLALDTCLDGNSSLDPSSWTWRNQVINRGTINGICPQLVRTTYIIKDSCGNAGRVWVEAIIGDFEAPEFSFFPADITIDCNVPLSPNYVGFAVAVDNCSPWGGFYQSYSESSDRGTDPNQCDYYNYTLTRTWTAIDTCSNAINRDQIINVQDTTAPQINAPSSLNQSNDPGACGANVTSFIAQGSDNCSPVHISNDYTSNGADASGYYPVGTTQVIFTASDVCGNISYDTTNVTISDGEAPLARCVPNITVYLDSLGMASLEVHDVDNGSTDNCGIDTMFMSREQFTCASSDSTINMSLTVVDTMSLTASCTANVYVKDSLAPTAICAVTNQGKFEVFLDYNGNATLDAQTLGAPSYDNCSIFTYEVSQDSFGCNDLTLGPIGPRPVSLKLIDESGNADSVICLVYVRDSIPPYVNCSSPAPIQNLPGQCQGELALQIPVTGDNCYVQTWVNDYVNPPNGLAMYPVGITPVTWTITDKAGNNTQCLVQVEVRDTEAPVAMCQDVSTYLDSNGIATLLASQVDAGSQDNCGIQQSLLSQDTFSCLDRANPVQISLLVSDAAGNKDSCNAWIHVKDTLAPRVLCQDVTIYLDNQGYANLSVSDIDAGSFDNCRLDTLYTAPANYSCANLGQNTAWLIARDDNSPYLTDSCQAQVRVLDTLAPVAQCQGVDIFLDQFGQANLNPAQVDGGSMDNCAIVQRTVTPSIFDCGDRWDKSGPQTASLQVEDAHGNMDVCQAQVRVFDMRDPNAMCMNALVRLDSTGKGYLGVAQVDNGSSDNCGILTRRLTKSVFDCNDVGNFNLINLLASDSSGNVDICVAIITVEDKLPPVAIAQDLTIYLDSLGQGTLDANQVGSMSYDNCGIDSMSIHEPGKGHTRLQFDCNDVSPVPFSIVLTVTDPFGNTSTDTAMVMVVDSLSPWINLVDQTLCNDQDSCGAYVNITAQAEDNCQIVSCNHYISINPTHGTPYAINGTGTDASGNYPVGVHTVNYLILDEHGNGTRKTITVTVNDCEYPRVDSMPADLTFSNIPGDCYQAASWPSPVGKDNCCLQSFAMTTDNPSVNIINFQGNDIGIFPIGETKVYYTATDCGGLITVDSFTVTVNDTEAPTITCGPNITQANDPGQCGAVVNWNDVNIRLSAQDNCFLDTVYSSHPSGTYFPLGTTMVTYTVVDGSGNLGNCSFMVTVEDSEAPGITCPANQILLQDTSLYPACGAIATFPDATAQDLCSQVSIQQAVGMASGSTFPVGITVITYQATDAANNLSLCSFVIQVLERTASASIANASPTSLCHPDSQLALLANDPGQAFSGLWTASGPAPVSFTQPGVANTDALFTLPGNYMLYWTVNSLCSADQAVDSLMVQVAPNPVIDSLSIVEPGTVGGSDGEITVHASGGTQPYLYLWSDGQMGQTASSLGAGSYSILLTDALGCVATADTSLTGPTVIEVCKLFDWQAQNAYAMSFSSSLGSLGPTSGSFSWQDSGIVKEYSNGELHITGTLMDTVIGPAGGSFEADLWLINGKDWTDWQIAGGTWDGNPATVGSLYTNWTYYLLDANRSSLAGAGVFSGDTLFLSHHPTLTGTNDQGWQLGQAANRNNSHPKGLSGEFAYTSASGNYSGTGFLSGNLEGCQTIPFILQVQAVAMLEGPYDTLTQNMHDQLRTSNLIPLQEPYTGMGYQHVGGGREVLSAQVLSQSGDDAIVDWVIVELRDEKDPGQVVATRSALIQRDGDVVDTDGISPVSFYQVVPDRYHVLVRHRNHLGMMSGDALNFFGQPLQAFDFTNIQTNIFGSNSQKLIVNGKTLMYGGDADFNGQIQNSDDVYLWLPQAGTAGYGAGDYNLDGQVQNTDRQYIWFNNSGRGDEIPK